MNCAVLRNTDKKSKAEEERVLVPALPCPWLSHHQGLRPLHTQASVSYSKDRVPEELWLQFLVCEMGLRLPLGQWSGRHGTWALVGSAPDSCVGY